MNNEKEKYYDCPFANYHKCFARDGAKCKILTDTSNMKRCRFYRDKDTVIVDEKTGYVTVKKIEKNNKK